ncbi:MAG: FixH family protein [Woeseiaceae bacterium]|nr:FixH family protein [Woeseiaceae bacterium]
MIVLRIARYCLNLYFLAAFLPQNAIAHGGVVEEGDLCVIKVNYLRAHFKIYQPGVTGHKQYCEDLPVASESIFVMEYQHDSLSEMAIDFRIIRDVTGKGRFARIEDIAQIEDLQGATVYYQPPVIEPDIYTINYTFEEEGNFIGIVSAAHPETGSVYAAVFPFEVGFTGLGYWPFFIGLLVVIQIQYLLMSGRLKRWFGKGLPAATGLIVCLLLFPPASYADDLVVTYTTPDGDPQINRMHSWILHIETAAGVEVEGATVEFDGGMPKHNHGLPTKPRVTEELGGGDYKLDGVRFHMSGYWEIVVSVATDSGTSIVTIPLQL